MLSLPRCPWFVSLGALVSAVLAVASAGCGGAGSQPSGGGSQSLSTGKTVTAVSVATTSDSLVVGASEQFTATAKYSDNSSQDVTSTAAWTVSNPAVATISTAGVATGVTAGSTNVMAAIGSVTGTAAVTVTAAPKTLQSVTVAPASASIVAGATQPFTATATYSDGSTTDVTAAVAWSTLNSSVATIAASGLATGMTAGSATVVATMGAITGNANLAVAPAPKTLQSISVLPSSASVIAGKTQQFTATAAFSDGSTADATSTVAWTTTNPATASIAASGLATAVAAGSTVVTATSGSIKGTAALTVTAAPRTIQSIAISPASASFAAGATQQFTATATYNDGSTGDVTSSSTWTVVSTAIATISPAGLATGVAAGTTTVTASASGIAGTAPVTVTAKTLQSIAITPANPSLAAGLTQQFTATATYSDGSTANVTSTANWISANPAAVTISPSGLATAISSGSSGISAVVGDVTGATSFTVTAKAVKSISISPKTASIGVSATQVFTASATYTDGSTADVTSAVTWTSSNTTVATINSSGTATAAASGSSSIGASLSGASANASLTVTVASGAEVNVTTWHFDNNRSGLNPAETSLTPSAVVPQNFGKLFSYSIDGYAYAEPLLVSQVTINGAVHNVLYVATENDSVYAFDADQYGSGTPLWQVSLLLKGETPLTNGPITPFEGVTSTPVIDPASGTIYLVSAQHSADSGSSFRLNALDIATGAQKLGGPVTLQASVPGTGSSAVNGIVSLTNSCLQRAALLLANNTVYIGFGSCATGWLLAYDATSLAQIGVFNSSPNIDGEGEYASAGGIWMGSGGPAADSAGNVYAVSGNGPWDGQTAWADTVLKFNRKLQMEDYFTPQDYQYMDCEDSDLAAGGLLLLPGTSQVLVGGKTGKMYLLNTNNLGKEQSNDAGATQTLWFESDLLKPYSSTCTDTLGAHTTLINSYEIFGTAAYYNNAVYLGITPTSATAPAGIRQFNYSGTLTPGPYTSPSIQENTRGTTPFISANGSTNGIVWMIDTGQPIQNSGGNTPTSAILRAYDASQFPNEIYNSATNSADTPGYGIKFTSPIVANGKVYISTGHDLSTAANPKGEIDVYGLK